MDENKKTAGQWVDDVFETFADIGEDLADTVVDFGKGAEKTADKALKSLRNFIDGLIGGKG